MFLNSFRDRKDLALQGAQILKKPRNPNSVVRLKDLQTGERSSSHSSPGSSNGMALKLRPTGLGSGIDKDRPDYTVYCGGWGGPNSLR